MSKRTLLAFLPVTLLMTTANGAIRRIPLEYPAIQAAIDASSEGDDVLVDRHVEFVPKEDLWQLRWQTSE